MSNIKKIEFSDVDNVKIKTGEIETIFFPTKEVDNWFKAELHAIVIQKEAERRELAIQIANHAGCGLDISIYEEHTEYFLNFDLPEGEIQEQKYTGMTDERNSQIFVR